MCAEVKRVLEAGSVNFTALSCSAVSHQPCRSNPAPKASPKAWGVLQISDGAAHEKLTQVNIEQSLLLVIASEINVGCVCRKHFGNSSVS